MSIVKAYDFPVFETGEPNAAIQSFHLAALDAAGAHYEVVSDPDPLILPATVRSATSDHAYHAKQSSNRPNAAVVVPYFDDEDVQESKKWIKMSVPNKGWVGHNAHQEAVEKALGTQLPNGWIPASVQEWGSVHSVATNAFICHLNSTAYNVAQQLFHNDPNLSVNVLITAYKFLAKKPRIGGHMVFLPVADRHPAWTQPALFSA